MIKLSDRLQLIADQIETGETMADIGTDHGFLPLSLIDCGVCPKAILTDISGPSLNKAKFSAAESGIEQGVEFREGNGLDVLRYGEVDAVVIAGMGGQLISEILGKDLMHTCSFRKYIFQPRSQTGLLRWWLESKGFAITKNRLVREGKFLCEVIVALAPKTLQNVVLEAESPHWDLPEDTGSEEPGLVQDFAERKIEKENKRIRGLEQARTPDPEAIRIAEERIRYFRRFIK